VPGRLLEEHCAKGGDSFTIVSPFVKYGALERVLSWLPEDAPVEIFVRWNPDDLAAGVSDLSVWNLVRARESCTLYMAAMLHAKIYATESWALVGSANLTDAGMGWDARSNIELLVAIDRKSTQLLDALCAVRENAVLVDQQTYEDLMRAVEKIDSHRVDNRAPSVGARWLPLCRMPDVLYLVYSGRDEAVSSAAKESAVQDLERLAVPIGHSEESFNAVIAATLLLAPAIRRIDKYTREPRRFGSMKNLIKELCPDRDATATWQTTMRWLLHFCGHRYASAVPHHSEIFYQHERVREGLQTQQQ